MHSVSTKRIETEREPMDRLDSPSPTPHARCTRRKSTPLYHHRALPFGYATVQLPEAIPKFADKTSRRTELPQSPSRHFKSLTFFPSARVCRNLSRLWPIETDEGFCGSWIGKPCEYTLDRRVCAAQQVLRKVAAVRCEILSLCNTIASITSLCTNPRSPSLFATGVVFGRIFVSSMSFSFVENGDESKTSLPPPVFSDVTKPTEQQSARTVHPSPLFATLRDHRSLAVHALFAHRNVTCQ